MGFKFGETTKGVGKLMDMLTVNREPGSSGDGPINVAQSQPRKLEINLIHEVSRNAVRETYRKIFPEKEFSAALSRTLSRDRISSTKKNIVTNIIKAFEDDVVESIVESLKESNTEISDPKQLENIMRDTLGNPATEIILDIAYAPDKKACELRDSERPRIAEIIRSFAGGQELSEVEPEKEAPAEEIEEDVIDAVEAVEPDLAQAKVTETSSVFKHLANMAESIIKRIDDADVKDLAPLSDFLKSLLNVKKDGLAGDELKAFEENMAYNVRKIEKAWLERKYENKSNLPIELAKAKLELENFISSRLKLEIEKRGFFNVEKNKDRKSFHDGDIDFMGQIVAKDVFEDENIIKEIVEAKWKGEKWKMNNIENKKLDSGIAESFSNGSLDRAAYLAYGRRTAVYQVAKNKENKSMIAAWRVNQGLKQELEPLERDEIIGKIVTRIETHEDIINEFVDLRKDKDDAYLNEGAKKEIKKIIRDFIIKEFFVDVPDDGIIKPEEKKLAIDNGNAVAVDENVVTTSNQEYEPLKKEKFEMPQDQKDAFEDDLVEAIYGIDEIKTEELNIDYIHAEKYVPGNMKEKIETLLNKCGFIADDESGKAAEEYWKELCELEKFAQEVIKHKEEGKVCVVHEGNTFFVNLKREQEIPLQVLEEATSGVVGLKYLSAFIFGVRITYEKYVSALHENPNWEGLSDGKKREYLEKGIICYADKILDDNEIVADKDVREKIYKYAFTILNK